MQLTYRSRHSETPKETGRRGVSVGVCSHLLGELTRRKAAGAQKRARRRHAALARERGEDEDGPSYSIISLAGSSISNGSDMLANTISQYLPAFRLAGTLNLSVVSVCSITVTFVLLVRSVR